jgi:hypothetical protein
MRALRAIGRDRVRLKGAIQGPGGPITTMENRFQQTPVLSHEEQIARLQQLCSALQKALDVSEEQRRILRDMSRTAAELAESLEATRPQD